MFEISVIVPTLNEKRNIDPLLTRIFKACAGMPIEVIVVDDDSKDGTSEQVRRWTGTHPVHLVSRRKEKGLASAIQEGARHSSGNILVVMDADLSHAPESIPELVHPIRNNGSDMTVGTRYMAGGEISGWPLSRRYISRLSALLALPLTEVRDPLSGFFAVRKEFLSRLSGTVPGFKIALEIIARNEGRLRVKEIPIHFQNREQGRSKADFRIMVLYLYQILSLYVHRLKTSGPFSSWFTPGFGMVMDFLFFTAMTSVGISRSSAVSGSFIIAAALMAAIAANRGWRMAASRFRTAAGWGVAVVLTVFLRGALFSTFAKVLPAIPSGAATTVLSWLMYIPLSRSLRPSESGSGRFVVSGRWVPLVVYLIVLRLCYMSLPELIMEEAYYWNYAKHLDIGYLDHPPMTAWLIWLTTGAFGDTEFGVRLGAFICWGIGAAFIYRWSSRLFDRPSAVASVLLLASLPYFFGTGMVMSPDAPLTACWAGALYFLYQALVENRKSGWGFAGAFMGLGLLSKYTIFLLVPASLIFMAVDPTARKWFFRKEAYLSSFLAVILFFPVIVWNANHQWASFYFQGPKRISAGFDFTFHILMISVLLLLTPAGLATVVSIFKQGIRRTVPNQLDASRSEARSFLFFAVFTLVPLLVFIGFSLFRQFKVHWAGPLWLALIPVMGNRIVHVRQGETSQVLRKLHHTWPTTFVILSLLYSGSLYYLAQGFPGLPYPQNVSLVGWEGLGKELNAISADVVNKTGRMPLMVGMDKYKTASGIAFYQTKASCTPLSTTDDMAVRNTTSRNVFGGNGLMYAFWLGHERVFGRDMILVATDPKDLKPDKLSSYFKSIGGLRRIGLNKNGKSAGACYYVFAENFRQARSPAWNAR